MSRVASTPNAKATVLEDSLRKTNSASKGSAGSANGYLGAYNPSSPAARSNTTLGSTMTMASSLTAATTASSPSSKLHLGLPHEKSPNGSTLDLRRLGTVRRTYSSNSIKKKSVEVSPNSFVKIRLLGKGDVGKVYLVQQKDTDRLYAMK
ncbi:hypothetical protein BX616_005628, partial [Lobosporangium transversale]